MNEFHTPVLLQETIASLDVKPGEKYIDATLGGGGHTEEILKRGGRVLGIDVDQEAIKYVKKQFQISNFKFQIGKELILVQGNFKDIDKIARSNGFDKVKGILFDLGVSSHQLDSKERGFSFKEDAPLDMRMDQSLKVMAEDLVNGLSKGELYELFTKLGEEHNAYAISDAIVRARREKPIQTTKELAEIVSSVVKRGISIHPATRVFMALRIVINDELNNLRQALQKARECLGNGGRILVISFHSLEDRIVKLAFKDFEAKNFGILITKKPITSSFLEIKENKRARSAKLRIFELY